MKDLYRFPLKQHIGMEAASAVVKGDNIVRGQLIAFKGEDSLGADIHSSVSGVVEEVTKQQITIRAQGRQTQDYVKLKSSSPLDLIEEAGIVGLGGAGFPTWAKLSRPFETKGTVIVNGAECEPILAHNVFCMETHPQQLIRGLQIAMQIVRAGEGIIAVKEKHKRAIARLRECIRDDRIRIALLPDRYPMGEERAVIREALGICLDVDSLPQEADAVVINAETVCRIQEAVDLRKPLIDKNMTVAGKIKGNTELIRILENVPLGMSVEQVFERAGGLAEEYGELLMGGPFTGKRTERDAPVIKTTGALIATECFMKGPERLGLLVCACGAGKERLEELARSMDSRVTDIQYCKQARQTKGSLKCENPGNCPGQVQKILALKKAGAQAVLISSCTDCTNTVMSCAPKLGLPVYHCTDAPLRAVNRKLIRKIH